jgi:hypothetical protein
MKCAFGVLAVLLLVSTVAFGQLSLSTPFPQAANPALVNGTADESSPSAGGDMPASMAANQGIFVEERNSADLGSPFPQAANPALERGGVLSSSSVDRSDEASIGSPFPQAANPSR